MPKVKIEIKRFSIFYTKGIMEMEADTVEDLQKLLDSEIKFRVG